MEEVRILFVSANPNSTQKLELAEELRQFQHNLRGHNVKLSLLPAAQPEDLQIAIKSRKFHIVHFSGHAKKKGILMRGPSGNEELVPTEDLKKLFEKKGVKLAVLNACNTSEIADAIKGDVGAVIATHEEVDERAARMLSKVFYAGLSRGETIKAAYEEAREAIRSRKPEKDVYMDHGMETAEALLPQQKNDELGVEIEGQDPFDRYYYADYLEQQIETFRTNRIANLAMLGLLLYMGIVFLVWAWQQDYLTACGATNVASESMPACAFESQVEEIRLAFAPFGWLWSIVIGAISWVWAHTFGLVWDYTFGLIWGSDSDSASSQSSSKYSVLLGWVWAQLLGLINESRGQTALLDWLTKLGPTIPTFLATMQARWCVHSGEKIRQLVAMQELVRNSENLTQDLRVRLHKILDQTLTGAEPPSPIATVFGDLYRQAKIAFASARRIFRSK